MKRGLRMAPKYSVTPAPNGPYQDNIADLYLNKGWNLWRVARRFRERHSYILMCAENRERWLMIHGEGE